jgi:SAM-dependent methyltransferase
MNAVSIVFEWKQEDFQKLVGNCPDEPVTPYIFKYFSKEDRLLEAGCGSGRYVYYLKNLGYDITGIEINQKTVDVLNELHPDLDIIQGDVRKLPFSDESISGILSLGVIEHVIEGLDGPIKEMHRVLRKGGYALVIVPSFNFVRRIKYMLGVYHIMGLLRYSSLVRIIFGKAPLRFDGAEKKLTNKTKFKRWRILGEFLEYRLTKDQFETELKKVGFSIVESVPVSLIDGVYHEFGRLFVSLKNHTFYPNAAGRWLNNMLSKIPFCHNHMHLCIVKK